MVVRFEAYEMVLSVKRMLNVVIRLSPKTTTLRMLKASRCKFESETVCKLPSTERQKTEVFEKRNPRQYLPAGA